MLTNVGAGGGAAAAPVAGGAAAAEAAPAAAEEEKKKEEGAFDTIVCARCVRMLTSCREGGVGRGHGLRFLRLNAFFPFLFLLFRFLVFLLYPLPADDFQKLEKKKIKAGRSDGRWALCACWHHGEGSKKKNVSVVGRLGRRIPRWDVYLSVCSLRAS